MRDPLADVRASQAKIDEAIARKSNAAKANAAAEHREAQREARKGRLAIQTEPRKNDCASESLPKGGVQIVCGTDVKPEPIDWLWRGFLARKKLHLIAGPPATGKTTVNLSWFATKTRGGMWPDGTPTDFGDVLIWSGEDSIADTLVPRLIAAGADMQRVHFVTVVREEGKTRAFDPGIDIPALLMEAAALPNLCAIMLDPIVVAVRGDSHKNAEVRRGLQPVIDMAEALNVAVIGITHFAKGSGGKDPLERIIGSIAFSALARIVFATVKRDPEKGEGRLLVRAKSNIGPDGDGWAYDLDILDRGGPNEISCVRWIEMVRGDPRVLLADAEPDPGTEYAGQSYSDAKQFLRDLLRDGPVPVKDIRREAEGAGHAWSAIRRAQIALKVRAQKEGGHFGGAKQLWKWALPSDDSR